MSRILIIGGPRTGKTTHARNLSQRLRVPFESFDDLIGRYDWSDTSDFIAEALNDEGDWIREGVAGVRGLRKWLRRNEGIPPFEIVVLSRSLVPVSRGQIAMIKGTNSMIKEVMAEVERRRRDG